MTSSALRAMGAIVTTGALGLGLLVVGVAPAASGATGWSSQRIATVERLPGDTAPVAVTDPVRGISTLAWLDDRATLRYARGRAPAFAERGRIAVVDPTAFGLVGAAAPGGQSIVAWLEEPGGEPAVMATRYDTGWLAPRLVVSLPRIGPLTVATVGTDTYLAFSGSVVENPGPDDWTIYVARSARDTDQWDILPVVDTSGPAFDVTVFPSGEELGVTWIDGSGAIVKFYDPRDPSWGDDQPVSAAATAITGAGGAPGGDRTAAIVWVEPDGDGVTIAHQGFQGSVPRGDAATLTGDLAGAARPRATWDSESERLATATPVLLRTGDTSVAVSLVTSGVLAASGSIASPTGPASELSIGLAPDGVANPVALTWTTATGVHAVAARADLADVTVQRLGVGAQPIAIPGTGPTVVWWRELPDASGYRLTVSSAVTGPGAPTITAVRARPEGRIIVRWTPPTTGAPVERYQVQIRRANGDWRNATRRPPGKRKAILTGRPGVTYSVRVAGLAGGAIGEWSAPRQVTAR